MSDTVDKVLGISSGVSAALAFIFYKFYKGKGEFAREVKKLSVLQPGASLYDSLKDADDGEGVPYAAVEGVVKELGRTIKSHHLPVEGVMLRTQITEHKSKRVNGFWSDMKKNIRDNLQSVPFALVSADRSADGEYKVEIVDARSASHLQGEMDITYDRFEPHKSSLVETGIDRIFGEVTRGVQETESMLINGTSLLTLGRVFSERGRMKLGEPLDRKYPFIVTKQSIGELIKSFESQSKVLKVFYIMSTVISGSLLAWLIWRNLKKWLNKREQRIQFEKIRKALKDKKSTTSSPHAETEADNSEGDGNDENCCVVCLTNAREVIALPCGHISSCLRCAEALPEPKKCPICRADVERFMQAFYS